MLLDAEHPGGRDEAVTAKVEVLISKIDSEIGSGVDKAVQNELARILRILPDLVILEDPILVSLADIAASSLLKEKP
jgi:hypothetical protein